MTRKTSDKAGLEASVDPVAQYLEHAKSIDEKTKEMLVRGVAAGFIAGKIDLLLAAIIILATVGYGKGIIKFQELIPQEARKNYFDRHIKRARNTDHKNYIRKMLIGDLFNAAV